MATIKKPNLTCKILKEQVNSLKEILTELQLLREHLLQEGETATIPAREEFENKREVAERLKGYIEVLINGVNLKQDLTDLSFLETFQLDFKLLFPSDVFRDKEPTPTTAGIFIWNDFGRLLSKENTSEVMVEKEVSVASFLLDKKMTGEILKTKLGKVKPFTISQLGILISNQVELENRHLKVTSPLDSSGLYNRFLVKDEKGNSFLVSPWFSTVKLKWSFDVSGQTDVLSESSCVFFCNN